MPTALDPGAKETPEHKGFGLQVIGFRAVNRFRWASVKSVVQNPNPHTLCGSLPKSVIHGWRVTVPVLVSQSFQDRSGSLYGLGLARRLNPS